MDFKTAKPIGLLDDNWVITCLPETGHQYFSLPVYYDGDSPNLQNIDVQAPKPDSIAFRLEKDLLEMADGKDWDKLKPWLYYRVMQRTWGEAGFAENDFSELNRINFPVNTEVVFIDFVVDTALGNCARGFSLEVIAPVAMDDDRAKKGNSYREGDLGAYVATGSGVLSEQGEKISISTLGKPPPEITVKWLKPDNPIPVELMVDFGNTRTCAVVIEQHSNASLNQSIRPLRFLKDGLAYQNSSNKDDVLPDSFIVLRQALTISKPIELCKGCMKLTGMWPFQKEVFVPKSITKIQPHQFVEISPAVMGSQARESFVPIDPKQGRAFISSPKRYLWDTDTMNLENNKSWTMLQKGTKKGLSGTILGFLSETDETWSIDSPLTSRSASERPDTTPDIPNHPRAQAMVWAALAILESAYRQINSHAWRSSYQNTQQRYLQRVVVTYPAGWTQSEIGAYRRRWQEAIDIFALTRFENPSSGQKRGAYPELVLGGQFSPDEAVAAQLPILYGEMKRLRNVGENWMEVFGRPCKLTDNLASQCARLSP